MKRLILTILELMLLAAPAFALDAADIERIRRDPRHFHCQLDQRFQGNVHGKGYGYTVSHHMIEKNAARGRPSGTSIELIITPGTRDGHGSAKGAIWPGEIDIRKEPTPISIKDVVVSFITFPQDRQEIAFTLMTSRLTLPLSLVQTDSGQWWLSISSAIYPITRTHDYLCKDLPSAPRSN